MIWPIQCAALVTGTIWSYSWSRWEITRDGVLDKYRPWAFGDYNTVSRIGLAVFIPILLRTAFHYNTWPGAIVGLCLVPLMLTFKNKSPIFIARKKYKGVEKIGEEVGWE